MNVPPISIELARQFSVNLDRMSRELRSNPAADQRAWRSQMYELWQITVSAADTCPLPRLTLLDNENSDLAKSPERCPANGGHMSASCAPDDHNSAKSR